MKRIYDMSDQEIYDLTDEQVEQLFKRECMERGISFTDEPPVMGVGIHKPLVPYGVFYVMEDINIAVLNQDDAIRISKFLSGFDLYKTSYDFNLYCPKLDNKIDKINLTSVSMFKEDELEAYNRVKEENDRIKREYDDQLRAYKDRLKEREAVRGEIWGMVSKVRDKIDRMRYLGKIFIREYLPLVDNDMDKAMKFFRKTYDIDDNTESFIKESVMGFSLFDDTLSED